MNENKEARFRYVVDMSEKPQDPGNVNKLCLERQKQAEALANRMQNPVTV